MKAISNGFAQIKIGNNINKYLGSLSWINRSRHAIKMKAEIYGKLIYVRVSKSIQIETVKDTKKRNKSLWITSRKIFRANNETKIEAIRIAVPV